MRQTPYRSTSRTRSHIFGSMLRLNPGAAIPAFAITTSIRPYRSTTASTAARSDSVSVTSASHQPASGPQSSATFFSSSGSSPTSASVAPSLRQLPGDRGADPPRRSGDEDDLAGQRTHRDLQLVEWVLNSKCLLTVYSIDWPYDPDLVRAGCAPTSGARRSSRPPAGCWSPTRTASSRSNWSPPRRRSPPLCCSTTSARRRSSSTPSSRKPPRKSCCGPPPTRPCRPTNNSAPASAPSSAPSSKHPSSTGRPC